MAKILNVAGAVVNRTGGGGAIGYSHVKQQKPDGHAIMLETRTRSLDLSFRHLPFRLQKRVPTRSRGGASRRPRSACAPTRRGRR